MSKPSAFKQKKAKDITRKMLLQKIEEMAALITLMEQTLTEWEIWHRLLPLQKEGLTQEQFESFLADGPIFNDSPSKIMQTIRNQVPKFEKPTEEEKQKQDRPALLDASGNVIESRKT